MLTNFLFDVKLLVDDIPDTPCLSAKTQCHQTGPGVNRLSASMLLPPGASITDEVISIFAPESGEQAGDLQYVNVR